MAKIKQGILGGFSGKVAGVVGTSWKGRAVMKSRPLSVSNPKTDSQVEQRGKFSDIAALASKILTTFVQPVENPISGDISGYNKFVKDNKAAFDGSHKLVAANFKCGGGKLVNLEDFAGGWDSGDSVFNVTWTNSAGTSAIRKTDKVYVAVFDEYGTLCGVSSGAATRNDQTVDVAPTAENTITNSAYPTIILYAVVSADGRDASVMTAAYSNEE